MSEKRPVIENEQIVFEGLFNLKDLYRLFNEWISDKGYAPVEKRVHESVTRTGKHVELELEPFKKFTDYAKSVIRIHLTGHNLTDAEVTIDGKKKKLQKGKLIITFDSWLETDYAHRWETKPVFLVLRTIFEKYVYTPFLSGFAKGVRDDTYHLRDQITSYLGLTKFV